MTVQTKPAPAKTAPFEIEQIGPTIGAEIRGLDL